MALPDGEDPGLDLHEWESRFQQLEPELADDPAHALPELADLVSEMLEARGADLADPVRDVGDERGFVLDYDAARDTADRAERGEDVDPGDIAAAVNALRETYASVIAERRAP
jgi:hypothetical protein